VRDEIRRRWAQHRALVLVLAAGVAVRAVAPLLQHKAHDPAVVCLDEAGRSVIPLLGGHRAGANELAQRIATLTGGHAAITTASDVQHLPALDLLGSDAGWKIATSSALTHASACLVNGDPLGVFIDPALPETQQQARAWLQAAPGIDYVEHLGRLADNTYRAGLIVSHRLLNRRQHHLLDKCVLYHPPVLIAGVGSRQGVPAAEIRDALETTLSDAGLALASVAALATAEMKADEPGLVQAAQSLEVPLRVIERAHLEALAAEGYSTSAAQRAFGIPGVAEPCAVLVAGGDRNSLLVRKHIFAGCTVAVALLRQAAHTEGNSLCP
jgi:cobalt-precorrin 5A hydrolase/precorrin-3B C17-methyltransferase